MSRPSRANIRLGILFTVLGLVAYAKWGCHSNPDAVLASTPSDAAALRALQARVQAAAKKVMPTIVAVQDAGAPSDRNSRRFQSFCSGVIITADGLVLSQFHVSHRLPWKPGEPVRSLQFGDRSTVILSNGRKVEAELLGADQTWELSLLHLLEPGPYQYVPLEPEANVQLGDWVLKFGHPLGYRSDRPPVVRLGRVLYRDAERFVSDCMIDGGDSGGPLVDLDGRFVGMIGDSEIPSRLQMTTIMRLFNCTSSSIVRHSIPSMLRNETQSVDQTVISEGYKRIRNAENILPIAQWTQGLTTALAFRNIANPATSSMVQIRNESDEQVALGTIVDPDGWILTVASLLPAEPKCRLTGDRILPAEVVGVNPAYDLALLKVSAANLAPVKWANNSSATIAGTVLAAPTFSPMHDGSMQAVGVISVPTRDLLGPFPKRLERPKIHAEVLGLFGAPSDKGFRLDSIDVAADDAGIQVGDILVSIADRHIERSDDVWLSSESHEAGERVGVRVLRDGKPLEFSLVFDAEPLISSKPFADFPTLFEHDMPLPLSQCGGPVVDLDGNAVGISMYRGSYGCMAIPADTVQRLLPELKSGKLADYWEKPSSPAANR
jgi:serine protease Do